MGELWERLKRRKLVQWGVAYVAFAFALLQGIDIVAQQFGWPEGLRRGITLVLVIGFFVALVLAWYHGERGAQGVGGTELVIIALLLAVGGAVLWMFARAPAEAPAAVAQIATPVPPASSATPTSQMANVMDEVSEKSVAVLPFANESGKADEQFFSDGLSDDLINALSQFDGLKVISRNSAFQFRNSKDSAAAIGKALGVAHLLEGSVQRAQDQVRITATLVNAADGRILWSARYDKPYKDLFALQDAITEAVSGALKAKLLTEPGAVVQSDRPPGGNLDAYAAYQHGIAYISLRNEVGTRKAIEAFTEATRVDSDYAAAYARLAIAWSYLSGGYLGDAQFEEANANAREASQAALARDPALSLAHLARADVLQNVDMDWIGAEAEARRALQLAPNDAATQRGLAELLATLGQNRRAVELIQQSLVSDPRNASWYSRFATYLLALGRLDEARSAIDTAIGLQPGASFFHLELALIEALRGDPEAALEAARQETPGIWRDAAVAIILQTGPDRTASDTALQKLIRDHATSMAYQVAQAYAIRKDTGRVFEWLDRAWANRDPGINMLLNDPLILRYRDDPRFAAFCKKVGLPTTTDAVAMK